MRRDATTSMPWPCCVACGSTMWCAAPSCSPPSLWWACRLWAAGGTGACCVACTCGSASPMPSSSPPRPPTFPISSISPKSLTPPSGTGPNMALPPSACSLAKPPIIYIWASLPSPQPSWRGGCTAAMCATMRRGCGSVASACSSAWPWRASVWRSAASASLACVAAWATIPSR